MWISKGSEPLEIHGNFRCSLYKLLIHNILQLEKLNRGVPVIFSIF